MSSSKIAALVSFLGAGVQGFRTTSVTVDSGALGLETNRTRWQFEGNVNEICGGTDIWSMINYARDPLYNAFNIKWDHIEAIKEAHIQDQRGIYQWLKLQVHKLTMDLQDALRDESLGYTQTEEHEKLLETGLAEGSFQGSENAKKYRCGRTLGLKLTERPPRWVRRGYDNSVILFKSASKTFFEENQHRLDSDGFLSDCRRKLISPEETNRDTYCYTLCQEFKDIAQSDSYAALGEVAFTSARIKDELEKAKQALAEAQSNVGQCEQDWSSLSVFRNELETLRKKHDACEDTVMKAEESLYDLEWEVEDLNTEVEAEEEKLEAADKDLAAAGTVTANAKAALDMAKQKDKSLKGTVEDLQKDLKELREELHKAKTANTMTSRLKAEVTDTMRLMVAFSNAGLRQPLVKLGLKADPAELDMAFPEPSSTDAAPVLREAVAHMEAFCQGTAMPAFQAVLDIMPDLDLTPLCSFKDSGDVFTDLDLQVVARSKKMVKTLREVVSWLNPWKAFTKLSSSEGKALEEQLVSEGQLDFLEQVKSVYTHPSNSWFSYLIGWRKDGPHHIRVRGLKDAIEALELKKAGFETGLAAAEAAWAAAQRARDDAVVELKKVQESEALAMEKKASVQEALEALKAQGAKLDMGLEEWRAKVAQAQKELDAAREALIQAYEEGVTPGELDGDSAP